MGSRYSIGRGNFGEGAHIGTFCHELCKNGSTDRDAVWDAESSEPNKEPRIRWE